jgi:hypothetical protein
VLRIFGRKEWLGDGEDCVMMVGGTCSTHGSHDKWVQNHD